jgi:hypothetical protein
MGFKPKNYLRRFEAGRSILMENMRFPLLTPYPFRSKDYLLFINQDKIRIEHQSNKNQSTSGSILKLPFSFLPSFFSSLFSLLLLHHSPCLSQSSL